MDSDGQSIKEEGKRSFDPKKLTYESFKLMKQYLEGTLNRLDKMLKDISTSKKEQKEKAEETKEIFETFIQESIGAHLFYLPPKDAVEILDDFRQVIT